MKNSKGLAVSLAGALALVLLFATSAFADSRHQSWTRHGSSGHGSSHHGGSSGHGSSGHGSSGHVWSHSAPRQFFSGHSSRSFAPRSPAWRGYSGGAYRGSGFGGRFYNDGHRFYGSGRISRIVPWGGGYRVWLGGWGYPFFVPYGYWNPFRFRVGLFIGLNAFYDPLGYYSVYGPAYYDGYYAPRYYDGYRYDGARYDDGYSTLRGTVQSVDLSSGIVTIEDNRSRRVTSALLPPRDNRVDDIRPGDYIELSGDWVRGRRYDFDADRMERFDPRR